VGGREVIPELVGEAVGVPEQGAVVEGHVDHQQAAEEVYKAKAPRGDHGAEMIRRWSPISASGTPFPGPGSRSFNRRAGGSGKAPELTLGGRGL
jgi:hypothetical protein